MKCYRNAYGYLVDPNKSVSMDEVGVEVYNPHDEDVVLELRMGLSAFGAVPPLEQRKVCKSNGYAYLPFGVKHYSTRWDRSGASAEGITLYLIFGRDIGTGKKPTSWERQAILRGQRRIY